MYLWSRYDSDGALVGFTDNGTAYYYAKDAQGDVTGIIDGSCDTVVTYTYDAWGKLLDITCENGYEVSPRPIPPGTAATT